MEVKLLLHLSQVTCVKLMLCGYGHGCCAKYNVMCITQINVCYHISNVMLSRCNNTLFLRHAQMQVFHRRASLHSCMKQSLCGYGHAHVYPGHNVIHRSNKCMLCHISVVILMNVLAKLMCVHIMHAACMVNKWNENT